LRTGDLEFLHAAHVITMGHALALNLHRDHYGST
jgi:hypothetical protein